MTTERTTGHSQDAASGPVHAHGMAADRERLFDAAAEALVLIDPDDDESIAELISSVDAIQALFGDGLKTAHPAVRCAAAARAIGEGDGGALGELLRAFDEARGLLATAWVSADAAGPTEPSGPVDSPQPGGTEAASAQTAPGPALPLAADEDLVRDFAVRAAEHLDEADQLLLEMESQPTGPEGVDAVFRAFHTIKGMAGFLAFDTISEAAHAAENALSGARAEKRPLDAATIQELFGSIDLLRSLVTEVAPGAVAPRQAASEVTAGPDRAPTLARETSVRIDERRLDALLDTIGELVISETMVSAAVRSGDVGGIDGRLERLDKITRELQHMATSLRMVPMRATFRRMSRLVRDLSHKAGKPVELVLIGEDIELDKTVVDRIQDPLVHALRNAVDHGIESAAERRAAGKPSTARIELRAYHSGGSIHIDVSDDGRGISRDSVRSRAVKAGLIAPEADPSDAELLGLIFTPGFSTAETVTDVSGRGVGMDVVKRTVEELRGHIDISSDPGVGTTLSLRLPVTLAIIDGMACRVGDERFIVPVLSIERSVRPRPDEVHTVHGRGLMLATDDGLVPVVALHHLLGVEGAETDPTRAVVVIVDEGGSRAGLLVCELLGQQQTVIKPLGEGLANQPGLAGGAIMSDGRVGLILDAAGLVRLAHGRE